MNYIQLMTETPNMDSSHIQQSLIKIAQHIVYHRSTATNADFLRSVVSLG